MSSEYSRLWNDEDRMSEREEYLREIRRDELREAAIEEDEDLGAKYRREIGHDGLRHF